MDLSSFEFGTVYSKCKGFHDQNNSNRTCQQYRVLVRLHRSADWPDSILVARATNFQFQQSKGLGISNKVSTSRDTWIYKGSTIALFCSLTHFPWQVQYWQLSEKHSLKEFHERILWYFYQIRGTISSKHFFDKLMQNIEIW
jgi:hypothetical protein